MRRLVLLALVGLVGVVAQLVDGSLGMGYGVTCATLLVSAASPGGLIVLTNLQTLADWSDASGVTEGLLASPVFALWVLWASWAVKIEREPTPIRV